MYTIVVDTGRRLVVVEVSGFWTIETVGAFARELGSAVTGLGAHDQHVIVLGFDDADVAPGPVIEALRYLAANAPTHARRMALYAGSALKRLQVKRIADAREEAEVFATRAEAITWALAPDATSTFCRDGVADQSR